MFIGEYTHALDRKNRLFIPARFRDKAQGKTLRFVLTQGLEGCLYLYDEKVFESLSAKLSSLALSDKQHQRAVRRILLSGAAEVSLDNLGRILIPQPLTTYAGIKRDVTILGIGDRMELWAKEKWLVYRRKAEGTFTKLASQLEL